MSKRDAITDLILETFRLNGRLLVAGDALVADLRLTSARWQALGAMALSPVPLPVAHIARNMGLTRQAVQRLVNEMERDGLVQFGPNPHHQRARLVFLTARGKAAYDASNEAPGAVGKQSRGRVENNTDRNCDGNASHYPSASRRPGGTWR